MNSLSTILIEGTTYLSENECNSVTGVRTRLLRIHQSTALTITSRGHHINSIILLLHCSHLVQLTSSLLYPLIYLLLISYALLCNSRKVVFFWGGVHLFLFFRHLLQTSAPTAWSHLFFILHCAGNIYHSWILFFLSILLTCFWLLDFCYTRNFYKRVLVV